MTSEFPNLCGQRKRVSLRGGQRRKLLSRRPFFLKPRELCGVMNHMML